MKLKHYIDIDQTQLNILTILNTTKEGKKFSELNIGELSNDHFTYHINYLLDRGHIEKKDSLYYITFRGKRLMSDIDLKGKKYNLFRFSVTVNVVKNIEGKKHILVQKRKRHPYYEDTTTIAGKIKRGERVKNAAIRKFKEETGLEISNIKVLGLLRKIRFDKDGNFIEDVAYNVCYSENPSGVLIENNDWGEHRWCEIGAFLEIQRNNIDFGEYDRECILRIKNEIFEPFHFEQVFTINDY
jgi:ADP-ribose pyrophosphatase YjhB (NUDIX family)